MMILEGEGQSLWIFGYGSLIWKPGFDYSNKMMGHIRGHSRRFWQSNTTHRGTNKNPGRVATLVPNKNNDNEDEMNVVWGVAFQVVGQKQIQNALEHLNGREITKGGYTMFKTEFYQMSGIEPISVIVYTATSDNHLYTGPESETDLADTIINAEGPSGHNVEYVTRIAHFMRSNLPKELKRDTHLHKLDLIIRLKLKMKNIHRVEELWNLGTSKYDSHLSIEKEQDLNNNNKISSSSAIMISKYI